MATPTPKDIIHAYRHTFKSALRAVQYSKPARYVVRDRVRNAFRTAEPAHHDATRLARTIGFLDLAARERGLEHRVVKNLMHVWWEREKLRMGRGGGAVIRDRDRPFVRSAYEDFDRTIEHLNESMGLCIK